MKSSIFIAATSAVLAMASPIAVAKRAIAVEWKYEVVTVTVTAGQEPTAAVFIEKPVEDPPPPPPAPTTSAPPPPPAEPEKIVAPAPAPEPSYEPAPVVVEKPKPKPSPKPEAKPQPVVEAPVTGDYQSTCIKQHNVHRSNHSAPALEWSDQLAGWAKDLAETCVFNHDTSMGNIGQNLASWGSDGGIEDQATKSAASGITDQWYNGEMGNWPQYGAEPPSGMDLGLYGHFTQVVWKSTKQVGCYTAKCSAGTVLPMESWYTVCNYSPPGNYGGEYSVNVLQPQGQATVTV